MNAAELAAFLAAGRDAVWTVEDKMTADIERTLIKAGRTMARNFKQQTTITAAGWVPPHDDELYDAADLSSLIDDSIDPHREEALGLFGAEMPTCVIDPNAQVKTSDGAYIPKNIETMTDGPATTYLDHLQDRWGETLSEQQRTALGEWKKERGYKAINAYLRDSQTTEDFDVAATVREIDDALATAPSITEGVETVVYRGVKDIEAALGKDIKVGDTFTDKGFQSVTTEEGVAMDYTSYEAGSGIIKIELPPGAKGGWLRSAKVEKRRGEGRVSDDFDVDANENREMVLARDSKFTVTRVETDEYGSPVVTMRMLPEERPVIGAPAGRWSGQDWTGPGGKYEWVVDEVVGEPLTKYQASLFEKEWVAPPKAKGINKGKGRSGGYTSDKAETSLTQLGEEGEQYFAELTDGTIIHPEGGGAQSPLDVIFDHQGFEVKTTTTDATAFKATPKGYEIDQKYAFADELGVDANLAIVVIDRETQLAHVYYREGLEGGRLSERTGWNYMGTLDIRTGREIGMRTDVEVNARKEGLLDPGVDRAELRRLLDEMDAAKEAGATTSQRRKWMDKIRDMTGMSPTAARKALDAEGGSTVAVAPRPVAKAVAAPKPAASGQAARWSKEIRADADAAQHDFYNVGRKDALRTTLALGKRMSDEVWRRLEARGVNENWSLAQADRARLDAMREVVHDAVGLADHPPEAFMNAAMFQTPQLEATFAEAIRYFPAEWVRTLDDWAESGVQIEFKTATRGSYGETRDGAEIKISGQTRAAQLETMLHELGHMFEHLHSDGILLDMEQAFYRYRTEGEPLIQSPILATGELTREDEWVHPYMGRDYGGYYYELLSMGMESLFLDNTSYRLQRVWSSDPEYTNFILGLLLMAS